MGSQAATDTVRGQHTEPPDEGMGYLLRPVRGLDQHRRRDKRTRARRLTKTVLNTNLCRSFDDLRRPALAARTRHRASAPASPFGCLRPLPSCATHQAANAAAAIEVDTPTSLMQPPSAAEMVAPRLYSIPMAAAVRRNVMMSRSGSSDMNCGGEHGQRNRPAGIEQRVKRYLEVVLQHRRDDYRSHQIRAAHLGRSQRTSCCTVGWRSYDPSARSIHLAGMVQRLSAQTSADAGDVPTYLTAMA